MRLLSFDMPQHSPSANDALARNLRRLRVARRWSLSELAAATGIGKASVSAIENGRANPTVDTLGRLADALDVGVAELLELGAVDDVTVVRAGSREGIARVGRTAGGEIARAALAPETTLERPAAVGARVHVVVTRGTLVTGPAERVTELGRGDYASFPGDRPYVLTTGRRGAEAVVVVESG
jgi:transcriptional regulator with XRE-family HTH domain